MQGIDLFNGQHGCLIAFAVSLSCNQSGTECTHDTRNIRPDRFAVRNFFKASKNSIIIESTALYNNIFAELRGTGNLDYLKERIFDNGIGKSRRDVGHGSTFLLRLLYLGVHKYGTACSQVDGMFSKKRSMGKILHTVV